MGWVKDQQAPQRPKDFMLCVKTGSVYVSQMFGDLLIKHQLIFSFQNSISVNFIAMLAQKALNGNR